MFLDLAMRKKGSHFFQISYVKSSKLSLFSNWQSRLTSSTLDKQPTELSQSLLSLFKTKPIASSSFTRFLQDAIFSY